MTGKFEDANSIKADCFISRLMTLLFLTRINMEPSGIAVNVRRSPGFALKRARTSFGTVIWPRGESVDSLVTQGLQNTSRTRGYRKVDA